jgi:NADH-quinone oxidoreductase E subunit
VVAKAPEATGEPALSDEVRAAIEDEAAKYPQRRGALLAALHLVQRERGWISPESMRALADLFDLEPLEVLEVVSFYNMFHDREEGRHHVYVCTNLPCSLRGARDLLRGIEEHLGIEAGETTSDGRITLGHEECLGACAWAPMLRVDETYHEGLDLAEAQRILDALE